jgi:hypothetical protein
MVELKGKKQRKFWDPFTQFKTKFLLFVCLVLKIMLSFGGGRKRIIFKKIKFPPSLLRQATYEKNKMLCVLLK